jgi:hypothetical protein
MLFMQCYDGVENEQRRGLFDSLFSRLQEREGIRQSYRKANLRKQRVKAKGLHGKQTGAFNGRQPWSARGQAADRESAEKVIAGEKVKATTTPARLLPN